MREIKIPSIEKPQTTHSVTMTIKEDVEILMRNKADKPIKYEVDKADKHKKVDKAFMSTDYEANKYHEEEFDKIVEYSEDESNNFTEDKADKPFLEEANKITLNQEENFRNLDRIEHLKKMLKEAPIVAVIPVHELSRSCEFKSIEMWSYVNLPIPVEIAIDLPKSMKEKMPSPKPKIVVAKPI
jgi:hypothetical protein